MIIERNKGFSLKTTFPDEDDFRSFLLIIRPFTLNDDPIYYRKILSIIRGRILEEKCFRCLNECLRRFNEGIKHSGMNLQIDSISKIGESINIDSTKYQIEDIFKLLINGYYFHEDISKIEQLESLKDDYFLDIGDKIAKTMLVDMVDAYFSFFNFLDYYIISEIISEEVNI